MFFSVLILDMKRINLLSGQAFVLAQYNLKSSARTLNVRLYEADLNIFNYNLFNFSTFHSLLRVNESREDKSKDSIAGKKRENNTSSVKASQSNEEKRKSSQKNKSLTVRPEINYNDLQVKVKQIQKFINKGMSVSVKVENPKNVEGGIEGIFSQIQKSITEYQISAKIARTGPIIVITPIKVDSNAGKNLKENKGSNNSSNLKSDSEPKSC